MDRVKCPRSKEAKMNEKTINHLSNVLSVNRFVNVCLKENEGLDQHSFNNNFIAPFKEPGENEFCLDIDIHAFLKCDNEKQEAKIFRKIISKTLSNHPAASSKKLKEERSITLIMDKLNENLEKSALIIFHHFHNNFSEKEKDILRSIRKYIGLTKEKPTKRFLGVMVLSNDRVDRWELFPESNLDGRYVSFFECD